MRIVVACAIVAASVLQSGSRSLVADRVMTLTRDSRWEPRGSVRVQFRTWHPQGLVRIGETFFVSSVEVRAGDRSSGVGHLFKIDKSGTLIRDLTLGEGALYHAGGVDYDGTSIWVPVAEYRADSRSIVYRVDPESMQASEVLRVADHIGAVARNGDESSLYGVSWGSRRIYRWTDTDRTAPQRTINPSHYVDYQDCKYVGGARMLCTGVTEIKPTANTPSLRLGGIELFDVAAGRPIFQVPLLLWTASGLAMTQNPAWFEPTSTGLRGFFMPEDDASTIYVYDVETK